MEKSPSWLIVTCVPIHYSSVLLANGSVPGALLNVLANGILPSEMYCIKALKANLQIAILSFPFILWQLSQQHWLLRALLRQHFFLATKQFCRNKGSKTIGTHMKLAKYGSPTAG